MFTEEIGHELLLAYEALLSADERERLGRFRFDADRRRYAIARALTRTVLSRYADIPPTGWRFAVTEYGQPVIHSDQCGSAPLCFNLSRTKGMVVLAVRQERAVGVDVENVHRGASLEVANRFFASTETADLKTVEPALQEDRFFQYWTLKEAYVKARGAGLAIPLDGFSFSLRSPRSIALSIAPSLDDVPQRWRFWQLRPSGDHVVAVCAERSARDEILTVRRCVPLEDDAPLPCALERDSALPWYTRLDSTARSDEALR